MDCLILACTAHACRNRVYVAAALAMNGHTALTSGQR